MPKEPLLSRPSDTRSAGNRADPTPAVRIRQLTKAFGALTIFSEIDLEVHAGETLALIGPSGAGKSTLLRCINLLEEPTSGYLDVLDVRAYANGMMLQGKELARLRVRAGMVFQQFDLFPNMDARSNVSLAQRHVLGRSRREADERSEGLLARVGLSDRATFKPSQLSGGQKQRVAIARALALDPDLLLLDEPTSSIDPELRLEVRAVISELSQAGMTMVLVTHEVEYASRVADRMAFLSDGRLVEVGPPDELLNRPKSERTAAFLSAIRGEH